MKTYAVLDVGTNSIKFYIAEKGPDGVFRTVSERSDIVRLGEGLSVGDELASAAMDRSAKVISVMVESARRQGVDDIVAVGTMALRTARNAGMFIEKVRQLCGITIEIISGEEEARLSYLAVQTSLGKPAGRRILVFDTGGGSTEFIFGNGQTVEKQISLNIGAVRFAERILLSDPVTDEEYQSAFRCIDEELRKLIFSDRTDRLIGIGGTLSNLGAMYYRMKVFIPEKIHGLRLGIAEIDRILHTLKSMRIAERRKIVGLQPERADVILPGVMIVRSIMEKAGVQTVIISARGLRHGLIIDRFGKD